MRIESTAVGLLQCPDYHRHKIKEIIERICRALSFTVRPGDRVLLKPNLISAKRKNDPACTDPEFVAAVAEWFLEHGARVSIGDSPAFGTARGVMTTSGISEALQGLPVRQVNFSRVQMVRLPGGTRVGLAAAALDCDLLVNLPRVKAHSQLYVTLAIKNYFGTVVGLRKPWWHICHGVRGGSFASHLVDLLPILPGGITLADGITAMHVNGPVAGEPLALGLVAGSLNPVAAETALMAALGLEHERNPVWQECCRRGLAGYRPEGIVYTLCKPEEFFGEKFIAPSYLKPISFNPVRMLIGGTRRLVINTRHAWNKQ